MKALLNPENLSNRAMLHKNYGFALPIVKPPRQRKVCCRVDAAAACFNSATSVERLLFSAFAERR